MKPLTIVEIANFLNDFKDGKISTREANKILINSFYGSSIETTETPKTMNNKEFQKTVRSLSGKEVVLLMVESLRNPIIPINMMMFFIKSTHNPDICYGCAATNMLCRIGGYTSKDLLIPNPPTNPYETDIESLSRCTGIDLEFLERFEHAIDQLRQGDITRYNINSGSIGMAELPPSPNLPVLYSGYRSEELDAYEAYANGL